MNGLDVKWFKHYIGMTNDEKLKALFEIHGDRGFACTVMWSKILEKAATDGGYFRVASDIAYDDITLKVVFSDISRFYGLDFIKEVMKYFVDMKMLESDMFGSYRVLNWEKYQGTLLSTPRVQKHRENKELEEKITDIIVYFNKIVNKNYSTKTDSRRAHIKARLEEGYTPNQLKAVIVHKHRTWGVDPRMKMYVTPETLFIPKNFDRYLNEIPLNEQEAIASGTMLDVIDISGNRISITEEQFNRAEKGYYKRV